MDEKVICPYCRKGNVVRKGLSKLKRGSRQRYLCKDCLHKFSFTAGRKKFDVKIVLNAACLYNQCYSCEEVCNAISRKHKISISRASVHRWAKEYDLGYSGIRSMISRRYRHPLVIGRMFKHSGLIYDFKYHNGKLNAFGKFQGLKNFIFSISKGVDEKYFSSCSERCSRANEEVSANIKVFENTVLNRIIGSALKMVRNSRQRHSIIENLLLNCDRDTVAVEVPVWYWDKAKNVGVCGHIDVLQVKFGKVWILDYKPNAEQEDVDKVVSQLLSYATGLGFRAGVKLSDVKCCWFDEDKVYVFDADKVKAGKSCLTTTFEQK